MPETTTPFLPHPTNPRKRCRQHCLCVSLFVSLSITVSLVTVMVVLQVVRTETPRLREKGRVCFVCDYLGSDVETKDTLYQIVRTDKQTFCCLEKDSKLTGAFQRVISISLDDKKEFSDERLIFNKSHAVGAHFYLNNRLSTDSSLFWDMGKYHGLSFTSGLHLHEGSIIIPSPGRYLVYSHITYMQISRDSKGRGSFVHRITRKHPRQPNLGEITLLYNRETFAKEISSPGSSHLKAVLKLRRDDRLSVRISDLKSVSHRPLSNYFGILKLS